MGTTFVLKKVDTFPLALEVDTPLGSGKLVLDCETMARKDYFDFVETANTEDLFNRVVKSVRGAPSETGDELTGQSAMDWFKDGPVSLYLMIAFKDAYQEQYSDARRKNGQRLPRR